MATQRFTVEIWDAKGVTPVEIAKALSKELKNKGVKKDSMAIHKEGRR